jgi:hypothetical protein
MSCTSLIIGRAKNLIDEIPDIEEFYRKSPPHPEKGPEGMPLATLIGEHYVKRGKN